MTESFTAGLNPGGSTVAAGGSGPTEQPREREETAAASANGYCKHRIFGRGKVVQFIPPNKYKVSFPGFGLKVVIGDYLQFEE